MLLFPVTYIVFVVLLAAVFLLAALFFTYVMPNEKVRSRVFRFLGHVGLLWYAAWSGSLVKIADGGDAFVNLILAVGGFCGYQAVRAGAKHPWNLDELKLPEYRYPMMVSYALFIFAVFSPLVGHSEPIVSFFTLIKVIFEAPVLGFVVRFIALAMFGGLFGFGLLAIILTVIWTIKGKAQGSS